MKYVFLLVAIVLFSCNSEKNYDFKTVSAQVEKDSILLKIVPYFAKLPKGVVFENRFNSEFTDAYQAEIMEKKYKFDYYFIKDNKHYFFVSRIAPSLYQKRIGIAGIFDFENNTVTNYQEVFWTFKMPEEDLKKKGLILFEKMVIGENLEEFYPLKKGNEEWIEFPDDKNRYDFEQKRWVTVQ